MTRLLAAQGSIAVVIGLFLPGPSAPAAAQSSTADPWSLVPSFPASCDVNDSTSAVLSRALAAVNREIALERAHERAGARSALIAGTAANSHADIYRDTAFRQLIMGFNITVAGAADPVDARIDQLIQSRAQPAGASGFSFADAADEARYLALQRQRRTDYETICRGWFGTNGEFLRWLGAHRKYLIDVVIPSQLDADDAAVRTAVTLSAIHDHLVKALAAYGQRKAMPAIPDSFVSLRRRRRRAGRPL